MRANWIQPIFIYHSSSGVSFLSLPYFSKIKTLHSSISTFLSFSLYNRWSWRQFKRQAGSHESTFIVMVKEGMQMLMWKKLKKTGRAAGFSVSWKGRCQRRTSGSIQNTQQHVQVGILTWSGKSAFFESNSMWLLMLSCVTIGDVFLLLAVHGLNYNKLHFQNGITNQLFIKTEVVQ